MVIFHLHELNSDKDFSGRILISLSEPTIDGKVRRSWTDSVDEMKTMSS